MATSSSSRVTKSTKSKGSRKPELPSAAIASIENEFDLTNVFTTDPRTEKKPPQGVVIDGKTYTCAACKSGHRVGVCKHARERPMTATHPPGRPAAGATKKVVCDCPKDCKCAKKDCKCPRECACVQTMYMLVYIPGPGEDGSQIISERERGIWKIEKEVTTDLKGNILSEEQIQKRREQKENQKECCSKTTNLTTTSKQTSKHTRITSVSDKTIRSRSSSIPEPRSPSEAKPKDEGGCCRHKELVEKQMKKDTCPSGDPPHYTSRTPAHCNCGTACRCAFCPEHSNNATSHNVVRQQFNLYQQSNHFPSSPFPANAMLTSFDSGIAPNMSCMGGQPRFALSCYQAQPSFSSFDQAFPTGGGSGAYLIAYPMHPKYAPPTSMTGAQPPQVFASEADMAGVLEAQSSTSAVPMSAPVPDLFNFADYTIGEAFVANDGPNGWQRSEWPSQGLPTPDMFADYNGPNFPLLDDGTFNNLDSLANWESSPLNDNKFTFSPDMNHVSDQNVLMTPLPSRTPSGDHTQSVYLEQPPSMAAP